MTVRRTAGAAPLALAAFALALAAPAFALTKIEGEYQLMLDMRKSTQQRNYPWDFDSNNSDNFNNAQLRIFSQPRAGVEAFMKFETDWNPTYNSGSRPQVQFRESHVRFRWDQGTRGVDSYLFSRQDRFYIEKYLIEVVKSDVLKRDFFGPNAQGLRLESWGYLGANGQAIASDDVAGVYAARLKREFLQKRLRLGTTFARKEDRRAGAVPERSEVVAFDSRFNYRDVDFSLEYAQSTAPLNTSPRSDYAFPEALGRNLSLFRWPTGLHLPDRGVLVAEIRSLHVGTPKLGYLNVAPFYWRRGPRFENRTGDANRDEIGYRINSWYLLPDRAVTLTSNYGRWSKNAYERREDVEFYNEAYVEFVNGFTGKTYFRQKDIRRFTVGSRFSLEEHDDWFNELQVESRLAWMRVQSKVKDVGQPTRKQLYSLETRINLTDKIKTYNRYTFGNDPNRLRKGIFSQLQYYPSPNVVMFLEYGPGWIGDSATPVDDGDLEGSGDQFDMIKFILKGNF